MGPYFFDVSLVYKVYYFAQVPGIARNAARIPSEDAIKSVIPNILNQSIEDWSLTGVFGGMAFLPNLGYRNAISHGHLHHLLDLAINREGLTFVLFR